jgi:hypothetical protein
MKNAGCPAEFFVAKPAAHMADVIKSSMEVAIGLDGTVPARLVKRGLSASATQRTEGMHG